MREPFLADPDVTRVRRWDNQPGEFVPCACGCGESIRTPDVRGRPRRFRRGHGLRVDASAQIAAAKRRKGFKHSAETRQRLSVAASRLKPWLRGERNGMATRTGPLNPNYKDGSSPDRQRLYASAEWREVERIVRARDGYSCQSCGAEKRGPRSLHLHHVKPWAGHPELRFDADNIVTLCRDCHHDAHRKGVTP